MSRVLIDGIPTIHGDVLVWIDTSTGVVVTENVPLSWENASQLLAFVEACQRAAFTGVVIQSVEGLASTP